MKRLARSLGVTHRTLRWTGRKPATGLQEAARAARYRLLAQAARAAAAGHVLTAHTLDDQAETVLFRLVARQRRQRACRHGAGRTAAGDDEGGIALVRPLLEVPQGAADRDACTRPASPLADDPSNRDPRFTRVAAARAMPALAARG